MKLTKETIERYQRGGDIYRTLQSRYGTPGADSIATAARSGNAGEVTDAIDRAKNGSTLSDSTSGIFIDQILNDPLAAPLDSANRQLGKAFLNIVKNPAVLLVALALLGWAAYRLGIFRFKTRKI